MNSRSLVNILLLALLIMSGTFFYMRDNQKPQTLQLTQLKPEDIQRIYIPRDNENDILIIKQSPAPGHEYWQMKKPYDIKAHSFRVRTLLAITQLQVDKRYASGDLKLPDYALAPPRARIIFNDTEISFGKTNPVSNKRYLMADDFISLHTDQSFPLVSAQATSFIDLSLLNTQHKIEKIQLPQLELYRTENAQWLSKPDQHLNAEQAQSLIESWSAAQAFAIHKYLARKQLGKIIITSQAGDTVFDISDDDPWLILGRADLGIEYHLDASYKAKLFGRPDA